MKASIVSPQSAETYRASTSSETQYSMKIDPSNLFPPQLKWARSGRPQAAKEWNSVIIFATTT